MALGGALIEQLGLRKDEDTLGQWIAHHLAEKLRAHKLAHGAAKAALEVEIVDTILKFWKHRAYFPRGTRPFENYDSVLRALESFDPDQTSGRYFHYAAADTAAKGEDPASQQWIDIAKQMDRGARAIINFCIRNAAAAAEKPGDAWLAAAKVLPENRDFDIRIIKFITENDRKDDPAPDPTQIHVDSLKETQKDLVRLIGAGNAVYQVIESSIEALRGNPSKTKSKMRSPTKGANTGTAKKRYKLSAPKSKKTKR